MSIESSCTFNTPAHNKEAWVTWNIRLGWKRLTLTSPRAYYTTESITVVESYIAQAIDV